MSDEDLDNLLDDDLETKYNPLDKILCLTCLDYEYTNISKLQHLGVIADEEVEDKKTYINNLKAGLKSKIEAQSLNYAQALNDTYKLDKDSLKQIEADKDSFDMENGDEVYKFYVKRIKHRLELIQKELGDDNDDMKVEKPVEQTDDSVSFHPSMDSDMPDEPQKLERQDSGKQEEFDKSVKRAYTSGSVVLEEYDFTDTKKILRERLINYKQAIDYCMQIGLKKDIIKNLVDKAELIKQFLDTYDCRTEEQQLELIFKLPRDITPEDVIGPSKREEFVKYIQYAEKVIPQIQKERVRNMGIYKKQKDPISKENFQKLTKVLHEQEDIKSTLIHLAGNRWQPMPDIHITELHFPTSEDTNTSDATLQVKMSLPKSFENTYFRYYLIFRLVSPSETLDTQEIPILTNTVIVNFDLEEGELKKVQALKMEVELYQWRLRVFDCLLEDTEIKLVSLKKAGVAKRSVTWNEERFTFDLSIITKSDERDSVLKVMKILSIPEPYKASKSPQLTSPQVTKHNESLEEEKEPAEEEEREVQKPEKKKMKAVVKPVEPMKKVEVEMVEVKHTQDVPIPKELGADEIKDPDVQRNLFSVLYCTKRVEQLENLVKAAQSKGKRIPDSLRTTLLKFQSQKLALESAIENEQVSYEQYMQYLTKSLAHDKILLEYLTKVGNEKEKKLVQMRIECTQQEIDGDVEE